MPSGEHGHSLLIQFSPVNSGSLERCSAFPSGTWSVGMLMYNLVKGGWALWLTWYPPSGGGKHGSSLTPVMPAEDSCGSLQEQGGCREQTRGRQAPRHCCWLPNPKLPHSPQCAGPLSPCATLTVLRACCCSVAKSCPALHDPVD